MMVARDITERKKAEEHIRYVSFHDSVTGLYNRAYFEEEIQRLDTGRSLPVSFIIGDLNNLKLVNDTFGHNEGDLLLKTIAEILRKTCRNEDIIARWGVMNLPLFFLQRLRKLPEVSAPGSKRRLKQATMPRLHPALPWVLRKKPRLTIISIGSFGRPRSRCMKTSWLKAAETRKSSWPP
jgi:diguanylate cyclase (GGDEF)-like protein